MTTSYIGWRDENGIHLVTQDTGDSRVTTRWSLRSQEWANWQEGGRTLAQALLADLKHDQSEAKVGALADALPHAAESLGGWLITAEKLDLWLRGLSKSGTSQQDHPLRLRASANTAGWVRSRAQIDSRHSAPIPEDGGDTRIFIGGESKEAYILSETVTDVHVSRIGRRKVSRRRIEHPGDISTVIDQVPRPEPVQVPQLRELGVASTIRPERLTRSPASKKQATSGNSRPAARTSSPPKQVDTNLLPPEWHEMMKGNHGVVTDSLPNDPAAVEAIARMLAKPRAALQKSIKRPQYMDFLSLRIFTRNGGYRLVFGELDGVNYIFGFRNRRPQMLR